MRVNVYFSRFISETLGTEKNIMLDLSENDITLKELIDKLIEIYGEKLEKTFKNIPISILIDGKLGMLNAKIKDGSKVLFMIPYAGG